MSTAGGTYSRPTAVVGAIAFAIGFALLAFAWAGANPPGAAPDEDAHVIKAFATGDGDLDGQPYDADLSSLDSWTADWFRRVGRSYPVPAGMVPSTSIRCYAFDPNLTAECQRFDQPDGSDEVLAPTHFGTYSPALYIPIGAAMVGADDYLTAEWRGRLVVVAICSLFIAWSAILLSRRGAGWVPLAGLAMAVTPLVVFSSASVNTSGIEITSAICLWVALLRIVRQPGLSRGAPWLAAAVSGGTMALSRPVDAALISVLILVVVVLGGWDAVRQAVRRSPRPALLAAAVLAIAVAGSAAWSAFVTAHPDQDLGKAVRSVGGLVRDFPNQVRQAIGIFGWNDTPMPQPVYVLFLLVMVVLVVVALRVALNRERLALGGLCIAIPVIHVVLGALVGFGMQGRYLLPLVAGVPLIATDLIETHRAKVDARIVAALPIVMFATGGAVQAIAFITNAHRYAVGANASWMFPWDARWTPSGGLVRWFVLAVLGVVLMVVPAMLMVADRRARSADAPQLEPV